MQDVDKMQFFFQCLGRRYELEEDEMGEACGTYGREQKYLQGFGGGSTSLNRR
jgi:hypothetical protein